MNVEIFLSISILFVIFLPLFLKGLKNNSQNYEFNLFFICKNLVLLILGFSILILLNSFFITYSFYGSSYGTNAIINLFKLLILFSVFFMILSLNCANLEKIKLMFPYGIYEFFILILFNILGLFCFLSAENFLFIYLGMELHSLTLSILFSLRYYTKYSTEAALKYFIVSSFSSSLFLFGVSFLYAIYGVIDLESILYLNFVGNSTFDFFDYSDYLSNAIIVSLSFIIISILIKMGSAPFHMWTIDVYEGAPNFITLYALVVPKIAYIGFFIKILFYFQNFSFLFFFLFKYSGLLSLVCGTFGALIQTKIKRIISYSAVANFGYILLALSTGTNDGIIAALLFLVTYIIVICSIFFILFTLVSEENYSELKTIFQLKTLVHSGKKYVAFLLVLLLFTLSSIPPFNIFISKYLLLYSVIEDFSFSSLIVILFFLLANILSCFYYIRLIRLIFFSSVDAQIDSVPYINVSFLLYFLISFFCMLSVFIFFYPQLLLDFFEFILDDIINN
jgi:NADH-quinone oxidoreductase subunit N